MMGSYALQPLWGAGTPLARRPKGQRDAQEGPAQDPVRCHQGPRGHGLGTPKIGAGPLGAEEGIVRDTRMDTAGPGSPRHEGSGPCRAGQRGRLGTTDCRRLGAPWASGGRTARVGRLPAPALGPRQDAIPTGDPGSGLERGRARRWGDPRPTPPPPPPPLIPAGAPT